MAKSITKLAHNLNYYLLSYTKQTKYLTCLFILLFSSMGWGQSTANYNFTFGASTLNAMTGSTSLMTGVQDDTGSTVFPIGFNFIYMGNVYSHISVNSNGQVRLHTSSGATAIGGSAVTTYASSTVTLAPMAGDNETGNGMNYLVTGSAPNRKLIIEWNNFYAYYSDPAISGNMQLVLNESTGVFEFIYGNIINSYTTTAVDRSIFHSSSNTANASAFVTIAATPSVNTSATAPTTNSFAANVSIANLANMMFTFTPTVTSAGPTNLTFASVTTTGMTLNWTAASPTTGIARYVVQRSTDGGVTFPVSTSVNLGTNTLSVTGLTPGINYSYRVVALSEGLESAAITGSQATTAAATYYYIGAATGSDFSTAASWNTNADGSGTNRTVAATSDILIVDGIGTTNSVGGITIAMAASQSLGALQITNNTAVTIQSSTTTQRILTLTGSVGDEFSIGASSSVLLTNITNSVSIVFATGTGMTGTIAGTLTVAGASSTATSATANSFITTGGTGTIVTISSTGVINNTATTNITTNGNVTGSLTSLIFSNGSQYNVSGATTGAFYIPLATWATNSNVILSGSATTPSTASNNVQSFGNFVVNLPSLTGTLSFWTTSTTAIIQGDLVITAAGATGGSGIFRALTSGTLTVNGNVTITQGRFQSASSTGTFNVLGNTTISSNGILEINGGNYNQRGATFTNDGTLTAVAGSTRLAFAPLTSIAQTFAGSGTVLTNIGGLSLSNPAGLTITHTNQITTLRVNLFQGTITGSNKITFGTGLALGCITQIGSTGLTTPGGSFDTAPTFNLGTGTYGVTYQQESVSRTTGFEIPSTRTVSDVTINNTNGLTIAGGNLDVTTTLTMTAGVINTSSGNILGLGSAGTLSGTPTATNMVNGPFNRTYAASRTASGTYSNTTVLPVGKGGVYTPIFIDPTTTVGGAVTFRGEAFTTNSGTLGSGVTILASTRYEAVPTTGAANLTSAFVRLTDVNVVAASKLLQASSAAGSYESLPLVTNFATGILTTATAIPAASYTGFLTFGEVAPCTAPADQATSLLFPAKSTTSLTASYTAAASNPTGYLVVSTASGTPATNPVDQTNYTVGATALGGTIAYVGSALSFNQTGLTANTTYDYTIFSYNNSGCAGPVYNISTPTTASVTTCTTAPGTPGTPTLSNNASTSFTASWTASSTAGVNYIIDVATNSGFTTFVSGYQALNLGTVLTTNITGLTAATPYWVRVRAELSGCSSSNTSSLALTTQCNPVSVPYSQDFESVTTPALPNCTSIENVGTGNNWRTISPAGYGFTTKCLNYPYNGTNAANAWFFTAGINLTAGTSYRISYNYGSSSTGSFPENLKVAYGVSPSSTSMTTVLATHTNILTNSAPLSTVDFTPSTTGIYYFGFNAFSAANMDQLYVDNISIILTPNTWTGNASTSWSTANNWSLTTVPSASDNIVISSNVPNAPVMDVDVTIPIGKSLTLSGTGSLTVAPGKVLTIAGTANFGGKVVTFKSDATGTAMLGPLTGTLTGATNVKVERFIPSGKRAFRLLSPAVTTTTFISGNWQGQTHITGGASGGFDVTETNNPSMFTYNNQVASGTGWSPIANTNATNLTAGVGYRMLVRGDRTPTNITAATTDNMNAAITLSATGTLRTGTVALNASSTPAINNTANTTTADYSLVGNPYQSAVDWNAVTKSGIDATYYAWDPNMGTTGVQRGRYVVFNGTTNDNVSSQVGQFIQPGQAFFVKNTVSGTAGTLTFQEAHKATTSANVFRTNNQTESTNFASLSMQLYDPNELAIGGYPIDATKAVFGSDYTNELGLGDATKLEAAGENIAWFRNNTKLAIDAAAPVTTSDELAMKTLRLGANKSYTFKIQTTNFDTALTPYLVDTFLNTQTEIATSQAFLASFATTSNVASYNENRFKIVFQNALLNTDTFATQVGLYPNPSKGNGFYLQLPATAQATVRLYNTLGQEIAISHNEGHYQAYQSLAAGVYHIMVTQGEKISKLKWIVE